MNVRPYSRKNHDTSFTTLVPVHRVHFHHIGVAGTQIGFKQPIQKPALFGVRSYHCHTRASGYTVAPLVQLLEQIYCQQGFGPIRKTRTPLTALLCGIEIQDHKRTEGWSCFEHERFQRISVFRKKYIGPIQQVSTVKNMTWEVTDAWCHSIL